uniref:Uncharacterized protein n=1 Tax=Solanum lycopersicum TaxID=4081 RepID=A0A3Q7GPZ9_SOLLC
MITQKKPLVTTTSPNIQSLDFTNSSSSSSYITFDENYEMLETSNQENDVTSIVNQDDDENIVILESNPESISTSSVDFYIRENDVTSIVNQDDDENIVILESNPESISTSSVDLYIRDFMDVSVYSSNVVDFWLELYMAEDNMKI